MSKMDALRAMREERYEQAQKAAQARTAGTPGTATRAPRPTAYGVKPATTSTATPRPDVAPAVTSPTPAGETACGHKNMGGRSCTRPHGHSEKSHRYT